ncbi:nuclear transport factor 2 family protein [Parvibaculaceae bacterium PLY_AMNH_Bact1]|nr:nuclear transport factor 2 family protein [Parvibaculaceae bacterium PLY_AMNH_Bact1]
MRNYPENFDHMLAAWNEHDLSKVRGHLEKAVAPDVHFLDPNKDVTGIDAFVEMVHEFRTEIAPDAMNSRASGVDGHNGLYRYNWAIHSKGELVLTGFDMCMTNDDGMISKVYGFFGPLPELES